MINDSINSQLGYGYLIQESDIKLHREFFQEMCDMIGVSTIYRAPRKDKHWTTYSEIESNYCEPIIAHCIFNEYPDQKTMKKLGWVGELDQDASIISVPYNLPGIQVGALFVVPSAVDPNKGRLFRVTKMSTIMIYPASVTCELALEWEDTFLSSSYDHKYDSFNLLSEEEDNI